MKKSIESETTFMGKVVLCDLCNKDYTNSKKSGGFLFSSKAVCPSCSDGFLKNVKKYKEEMHIKEYCPKGKSFADWVNEDLRGGKGGFITVTSWD